MPRLGAVAVSSRPDRPWVLLDADGSEVESVSSWLTDLHASDYAVSTLRSYAYDLLGWASFPLGRRRSVAAGDSLGGSGLGAVVAGCAE